MMSGPTSLRVLVVEDHPIVVEGLRSLLAGRGHEVVATTSSVASAIALLGSTKADVCSCDVKLADGSGLEVVRAAHDRGIPALVFSREDGPMYVREALRAGAVGYALKTESLDGIVHAIESVARRDAYFSSAAQSAIGHRAPSIETKGVTRREVEVLQGVAGGLTTKEIALRLQISPRTVETHRERLMSKLGVNNAAGLTRMALAMGVFRDEDASKPPRHESP